jgi:hypothetical protein
MKNIDVAAAAAPDSLLPGNGAKSVTDARVDFWVGEIHPFIGR